MGFSCCKLYIAMAHVEFVKYGPQLSGITFCGVLPLQVIQHWQDAWLSSQMTARSDNSTMQPSPADATRTGNTTDTEAGAQHSSSLAELHAQLLATRAATAEAGQEGGKVAEALASAQEDRAAAELRLSKCFSPPKEGAEVGVMAWFYDDHKPPATPNQVT